MLDPYGPPETLRFLAEVLSFLENRGNEALLVGFEVGVVHVGQRPSKGREEMLDPRV